MSDPRLNSIHLALDTRRELYRRARVALLGAEGWMTWAGEQLHNAVGEPCEWPSLLPIRELPLTGIRFHLIDAGSEQHYPLKVGLNTVGRLASNDIVLKDSGISRRHCVILVHAGGGCELHDTASLNGTWVDGRRVQQPIPLTSGACIQLCCRRLLVISDKDSRRLQDDDATANTAFDG